MAHYDLYESLGLDTSSSTADLASQLDSRIEDLRSQGVTDGDARIEEVKTARTVLGDDTLRSKHDSRLQDTSAPDMQISDLLSLAHTGLFTDEQAQQPQPPFGQEMPSGPQGYPQQGQPHYGYSQQGQPQPGFPQPGYPQQGYSQQSASQQSASQFGAEKMSRLLADSEIAGVKDAPKSIQWVTILGFVAAVLSALSVLIAAFWVRSVIEVGSVGGKVLGGVAGDFFGDEIGDSVTGFFGGNDFIAPLIAAIVTFLVVHALWGLSAAGAAAKPAGDFSRWILIAKTGVMIIADLAAIIGGMGALVYFIIILLPIHVAVLVLLCLGGSTTWFKTGAASAS